MTDENLKNIMNSIHELDKSLSIIQIKMEVLETLRREVEKLSKIVEKNEEEKQRTQTMMEFALRNWKIIAFVLVMVFGGYEGGKKLLYMTPPNQKDNDTKGAHSVAAAHPISTVIKHITD
ncbi:MAG: hypothetical protein ACPG47_00090 [Leucothrix sp.]